MHLSPGEWTQIARYVWTHPARCPPLRLRKDSFIEGVDRDVFWDPTPPPAIEKWLAGGPKEHDLIFFFFFFNLGVVLADSPARRC